MEEGYIILNESRQHRRRKEKKKWMVNFFKKGLEYRQLLALTSWNRSTKAVKGNINI